MTDVLEAQDFADIMISSLMNGATVKVAAESAVQALFRDGKWIPQNTIGSVRLPFNKWKGIRASILERDQYRCAYCGDVADCVDHVVPLVKGGSNVATNLAASCSPCNWSKGGKLLSEWRRLS